MLVTTRFIIELITAKHMSKCIYPKWVSQIPKMGKSLIIQRLLQRLLIILPINRQIQRYQQKQFTIYTTKCTRLPKSRGLTPKRRSQIQARWKEESERQSLSWWKSFFEYVNQSDFLANGSNGWKGANLEWLTNPNNMVKVIEGQYENE